VVKAGPRSVFGRVVGGRVGWGWVNLLFKLLTGTGGNCEIEVARRGEQYSISFSDYHFSCRV